MDRKWAWGREAERAVSAFLRRQGWYVTETCKIDNGGAPKAIGELRSLVLPDLQRSKGGSTRWAEIKFKDSPVYWRARNEDRHGVDLPNWRDYLAVEKESGIPGDLFVLQYRNKAGDDVKPNPRLLFQSFRHLRNTVAQEIPAGAQGWCPRGMVVWRANNFDEMPNFSLDLHIDTETAKDVLRHWREIEEERALEEGISWPQSRKW